MTNPASRGRSLVAAALLLLVGGCASSGSADGRSAGAANRISQAELADVQQLDALQAVQRLRPAWLRRRGGSEPRVMLDGLLMDGRVEALRTLRVSDVRQMEFLDASDATTRFGTGFGAGVILVTSGD